MAQLEQQAWIRDPFQADKVTLSAENETQLIVIDISCDGTLQRKF